MKGCAPPSILEAAAAILRYESSASAVASAIAHFMKNNADAFLRQDGAFIMHCKNTAGSGLTSPCELGMEVGSVKWANSSRALFAGEERGWDF